MSTTTITSSSTTTAAPKTSVATAAATKASAQKIISSLSAGSGVDVASLAQGLTDAERIPQENAINSKISKNDARVSGYSAIMFMMTTLKDSLAALKDANSFNAVTASNSNTAAFGVTTDAKAVSGSHSVQVTALATPQRSISAGFALPGTSLNAGLSFDLSLSVNGGAASTILIAAGNDTPEGVAQTINASGLGVTAQVINTGAGSKPYQIVVTGGSGSAQSFTLAPALAGVPSTSLAFSDMVPAASAADAVLTVNGVTYTRPGNSITDILAGTTLDLKTITSSAASVTLTRDTSALKGKITALVTAYNDANNILNEVSNAKSTMETYGATLVGDSTVRLVRQQLREMMLGTSSTPGTGVGALWQIGLSVDKAGVMSTDTAKLDTALKNNFSDVVKTFTGNQNKLSLFSTVPGGIAGDAVKKITNLLGASGPILSSSENANTQNTKSKANLTALATRMQAVLERYTRQFSVMDSLVGNVNSQKTSLKSSFDGMMAMYTAK